MSVTLACFLWVLKPKPNVLQPMKGVWPEDIQGGSGGLSDPLWVNTLGGVWINLCSNLSFPQTDSDFKMKGDFFASNSCLRPRKVQATQK